MAASGPYRLDVEQQKRNVFVTQLNDRWEEAINVWWSYTVVIKVTLFYMEDLSTGAYKRDDSDITFDLDCTRGDFVVYIIYSIDKTFLLPCV